MLRVNCLPQTPDRLQHPMVSSRTAQTRSITVPRGFRAAGVACGIKPSGNPDLALIVSDSPCTAAGVFTTNRCLGAPVIVTRRHLRRGTARAIVCNSGIANDATGQQGVDDALAMAAQVASAIDCPVSQVLPASTGIIGQLLPMGKLHRGIATLLPRLRRGSAADGQAARAILTTDLVPKAVLRRLRVGRRAAAIAGVGKGSGMIAPNLATMLVFITTDIAIERRALSAALRHAVSKSFNRISVDQHTSPSDMVLILANGAAGNSVIKGKGKSYSLFTESLSELCRDLAYQIVADGEGATKVFRVQVTGAQSQRDADRVGKAIVNSPLVKAAIHGGDPNWGRITTAAGYSGAAVRPEKMSLSIGSVSVFAKDRPVVHDARASRKLLAHMRRREIVITMDLAMGKASTEWLGCDLSREYVAINADYTT